jgi:hypothetical protein
MNALDAVDASDVWMRVLAPVKGTVRCTDYRCRSGRISSG